MCVKQSTKTPYIIGLPSTVRVDDGTTGSEDLSGVRKGPPEVADPHRNLSSLQVLQQQLQSVREK